ncbi:MAG: hypothetical protein SFZ23_05925 [Planctomycetota bacterium]|nr:hypothetical protein [Planctomycetota bacterium]
MPERDATGGSYGPQGGGSRTTTPNEPGFWTPAVEKQRAATQTPAPETRAAENAARKRRRRNIVLGSVGVVVILLVVLVALAPTIISSFAPGIVENAANKQLSGRVSVRDVSLSWFGPQEVGGFKLLDAQDRTVAEVSLTAQTGLLSVAFGGLGIGGVEAEGRVFIERGADGRTNLEQAIAPPPGKEKPAAPADPANKQPAKLPKDLSATVKVKALKVVYSDLSGAKPTGAILDDVKLQASLDSGEPIRVNLTARASPLPPGVDPRSFPDADEATAGTLDIDAKVTGAIDDAGFITINNAKADATITGERLPVALLDALSGQGGKLVQGLGEIAQIRLTAQGGLNSGDVELSAVSLAGGVERVSLVAAANLDDRVLTLTKPLEFRAPGSALDGLAPQIREKAAEQRITLDRLPDVLVRVLNLRVNLDRAMAKEGAPADPIEALRGAAIDLAINTTPVSGTIVLPTPGPAPAPAGAGAAGAAPPPSGPPQPFSISGLTLNVQGDDLAKSVRLTSKLQATINNQPAGDVDVDVTAQDLPRLARATGGIPSGISGRALITGMSTAIAQPFVAAQKLDLPRDVGPTVDLAAIFASRPGAQGSPDGLDATLELRSQKLSVLADAGVSREAITIRGPASGGKGLDVRADAVGGIAQRFLPADLGWAIQPGGQLQLSSSELRIPTIATGGMALDEATGGLRVAVRNVVATPPAPPRGSPSRPAGPVQARQFEANVALTPKAAPRATLNGDLAFENQPFQLRGDFELRNLFTRAKVASVTGEAQTREVEVVKVNAAGVRPVGSLQLRDVPSSLARLMPASPPPAPPQPGAGQNAPPPGPPLDLPALIERVIGQRLALTLNTQQGPSSPDALNVSLTTTADNLNVEAAAEASASMIDVKAFAARTTLTPDLSATLLQQFAPTLQPPPTLAQPTTFVVNLQPFRLPMSEGKPNFAAAGDVTVQVQAPGQTLVRGLTTKNPDGSLKQLGVVGVEGLDVAATVPLKALAQGGVAQAAEAIVRTTARLLVSPAGQGNVQPIGAMILDAKAPLRDRKPAGIVDARVQLTDLRTQPLEQALGREPVLPSLVGETLSADLGVRADLTPRANASQSPGGLPPMKVSLAALAPKLRMPEPLRAQVLADRITLEQPARLSLLADANLLEKLSPPKAGEKPPPRLSEPITIEVDLNRLTIAQGGASTQSAPPNQGGARQAPTVGPLKPGIFQADAQIRIPAANIDFPDGQRLRVAGVNGGVASTPEGRTLAFNFAANEAQLTKPGQQPTPAAQLKIDGTIVGLADASGNVDARNAEINAFADLPAVPTLLLDTLANQRGLLVEALGPTVTAKVRAERFSLAGSGPTGGPTGGPVGGARADGTRVNAGFLEASLSSDRASARLRGHTEGPVFVTEGPVEVSIVEITPELTSSISQGLPAVGSIEKTRANAPATITTTNLRVPLNGDMRLLSGLVDIDPGEANFAASQGFGRLLKPIGQRQTGTIGKRLQPLQLTLDSGIITYRRYPLPLGEFSFESEGVVNLVEKQIDVTTWIPFGALTDEAAGAFNSGLGQLIGRAPVLDTLTMLPFSSKGPMSNPGPPTPDLRKYSENVVKKLNPVDAVKDLIRDRLQGGKNK